MCDLGAAIVLRDAAFATATDPSPLIWSEAMMLVVDIIEVSVLTRRALLLFCSFLLLLLLATSSGSSIDLRFRALRALADMVIAVCVGWVLGLYPLQGSGACGERMESRNHNLLCWIQYRIPGWIGAI